MAQVVMLAAGVAVGGVTACGGEDGPESGTAGATADSAEMQRSAAATVEPGLTGDEVRNRLGEPRTRVTMDGGFERWTYYIYGDDGQLAARTLIIFGSDGQVVEVINQ